MFRTVTSDVSAVSSFVANSTSDSHYVSLTEMEWYGLFDALYVSNKMGVAKPALEFYERILTAESCTPDETLLIDDTEGNVASAEAMGLHGILFSDVNNLREWLAAYASIPPDSPWS